MASQFVESDDGDGDSDDNTFIHSKRIDSTSSSAVDWQHHANNGKFGKQSLFGPSKQNRRKSNMMSFCPEKCNCGFTNGTNQLEVCMYFFGR